MRRGRERTWNVVSTVRTPSLSAAQVVNHAITPAETPIQAPQMQPMRLALAERRLMAIGTTADPSTTLRRSKSVSVAVPSCDSLRLPHEEVQPTHRDSGRVKDKT